MCTMKKTNIDITYRIEWRVMLKKEASLRKVFLVFVFFFLNDTEFELV